MNRLLRQGLICASSMVSLLASTNALAQDSSDTATAEATEVEEVVVTGSRVRASGFSTPTPVTVLSAEEVQEQRAPSQVSDIFNTQPAFRPSGGPSQGQYGLMAPGQAPLDLRGLGTVRTLTLLDGRRHIGNQLTGVVDTNVIPTALLNRVEIVTGGASAAYGSDAVAGVVNFILDDRFIGVKGSAQYSISDLGDAKEYAASLGYGAQFLDGRARLIFGADVAKGYGGGDLYSRLWGRDEPGVISPVGARPPGMPAQMFLNDVTFAFPPGGVVTSGPLRGTAFNPDGSTYQYNFGQILGGARAYGASNEGFNEYGPLLTRVPFERHAFFSRLTFDVSDNFSLFGEVGRGRLAVDTQGTYFQLTNLTIGLDNPLLPTAVRDAAAANGQTNLVISRIFGPGDQGPGDGRNINATTRGVVGFRAKAANWNFDGYYEHGVGDFRFLVKNVAVLPNLLASLYVVQGPDGPMCGPVASNPNLPAARRPFVEAGCVPYDIFGMARASDEAVAYAYAPMEQNTELKQDVFALNAQGEPFATAAGPVSVAVGLEHRVHQADVTVPAATLARSLTNSWFFGNPRPASGEIKVNEGYAEVLVPLLKGAPFAESLDVNAAVRRTDYSTSGGVTTWKVGLNWTINDAVRLRATRSRDIRAPNIAELFVNGNELFQTHTNPATGASGPVRAQAMANPNLKPEEADTFTAGVVFQPQWSWAQGIRLSVDYYKIEVDGVITAVSIPEVLRRYYVLGLTEYEPFINFVPTSVSPTGFDRVVLPLLNANKLATSGFDIEAAYRRSFDFLPGEFSFSAIGTWVDDLETTDIAGAIDQAGAVLPSWRWTGNVGYRQDRFSANLQARYSSSRKYSATLVGPNDPNYDPTSPTSINKNIFPSAIYYTLSASYVLTEDESRPVEAFVVVDNLLDKDPPFGAWQLTFSGDNYYDLVGRRYTAGIRFRF